MTDITAVGEILIDLTQSGVTEQGIPRFDANPGGGETPSVGFSGPAEGSGTAPATAE